MNIQIIAYDPSTHAVVPRAATKEMIESARGAIGTFGNEWQARLVNTAIAAAPPLPTMDVVKRLEFVERPDGQLDADTHFGKFNVTMCDSEWRALLYIGRAFRRLTGCVSKTAARDACQREFDRLVAECLAGTVGGGG